MLTVQELVDDNADKIPFNWIAGRAPRTARFPMTAWRPPTSLAT